MSIYITYLKNFVFIHIKIVRCLIVKQKVFAPSWLITKINILSCTVSKTSKFGLIWFGIGTGSGLL